MGARAWKLGTRMKQRVALVVLAQDELRIRRLYGVMEIKMRLRVQRHVKEIRKVLVLDVKTEER